MRYVRHFDRSIVDDYFATHEDRKLHIGCGRHIIDGWLTSDHHPSIGGVLHLDATGLFVFEDDTLDYIFSEHMIEHVPHAGGLSMLNECFRALERGGTLRISTPALAFLIDLYRHDKSDLQTQYIEWSSRTFIADAPCADDTFVINNFFRDWGRTFIYDEKTLRASLERAGFTDTVRCDLYHSDDKALKGLENENRIPTQFLKLETLTLEARKPVTPSCRAVP